MNIPSYAQSFVSSFQATGQLPGPSERIDLSREEAQEGLTAMKDEFSHWQKLDETDADLAKGKPGEVRVAGHVAGEDTTASFSGTPSDGELTVVANEPTSHYGATSVSVTRLTMMKADNLAVIAGDGYLVGPFLTHIDHQLSSNGPVSLSGPGPVTVTLTDNASGGYILNGQQQ